MPTPDFTLLSTPLMMPISSPHDLPRDGRQLLWESASEVAFDSRSVDFDSGSFADPA